MYELKLGKQTMSFMPRIAVHRNAAIILITTLSKLLELYVSELAISNGKIRSQTLEREKNRQRKKQIKCNISPEYQDYQEKDILNDGSDGQTRDFEAEFAAVMPMSDLSWPSFPRKPHYCHHIVITLPEKANGVWKIELLVWGNLKNQNIAAVVASYLGLIRIARAMKLDAIDDELLLQTVKHIVRVMMGEEYLKYFADLLDQMIQEMNTSTLPVLSIQLNESTDVATGSQL
ncbi:hypothetical protein RF11_04924 [Thelohanellus kitauei]|uniref:Uncharacterized protein n=1 Tax=Thelohanellus kitauei TaxID=669202 RepID=A0A0C2N2G9_THEKT|nr:hypothetical protein RF11_04924 [Thelohanellus kitauei]